MNLTRFVKELNECKTEEAVKATFIKYANFKAMIKERVDLLVPPVLFEFKYDVDLRNNTAKVLAQALIYARRIKVGEIDAPMPSHIALVDKNEAVLIPIGDPLAALIDDPTDALWATPASKPSKQLVQKVQALSISLLHFDLTKPDDLNDFVETLNNLPDTSNKKLITLANYEAIYEKWCECFGQIFGDKPLGLYFLADLCLDSMFDATSGKLLFNFDKNVYQIPAATYTAFWSLYSRPATVEVQEYILQNAHMFMDTTKRQFEGAFYTPENVAKKAIEYLDAAFPGWQDDPNTYLYDPCCGTGNLEKPLKAYDRVFMSTLDMAEVLMLKNLGIFPGAKIFRFDFLNGNYEDLPADLRAIAEDPTKRLIILMNPPYGEASASIGRGANKIGVSFTSCYEEMVTSGQADASSELFNQFLFRSEKCFPHAHIGVFATLKYLQSPDGILVGIEKYRCQACFELKASNFSGVRGVFPISFIVWSKQ